MNTALSVRTRLIALVTIMAFSIAVLLPSGAAAQANKGQHMLSAFVQGKTASGAAFHGLFQITQFTTDQNNNLVAVGNMYSDQLISTSNPGGVVNNVAIPVAGVDPNCQILNLTLGPVHLDLLGLVVDLNQVVLNVTAQSGNGNLLGNLLCAVANLLNQPPTAGGLTGLLNNLTALLNQILAAL